MNDKTMQFFNEISQKMEAAYMKLLWTHCAFLAMLDLYKMFSTSVASSNFMLGCFFTEMQYTQYT